MDPSATARRNSSIARRLFIGAVVWALVSLLTGSLLIGALYRAQLIRMLDAELDATLVELTRALDSVEVERDGELIRDGRVVTVDSLLPRDQRYAIQLSGRYWAVLAVTPDGEPDPARTATSPSVWDGAPPLDRRLLPAALANTGTSYFGRATGPADEPLRVAMRAVRFENRSTPVLLVAAADQSQARAQARQFLYLFIGAMTLLAGGLLVAMWAQLRYGLAPLQRVRGDVIAVREGRRDRLATDYPVEVQPLTDELNKLLDHNREVVSRAQTHVGNLAHALKTPIAVLMNEARGTSPLEQLVRRQAEAMSGNVQHYLKRAQAAARAEVLGARCEVEPVIADLSRLLMRLFADKGIDISTEAEAGTMFRGERQDLEELMGNLMENACKWARRRVDVSARREADMLVLRIEDDGPGLTPVQREVALKRGGRLDEHAPGTGLGLSIVSELVELHRGTLELGESRLGGLKVEMRFPQG